MSEMNGTKRCGKCKEIKPLNGFGLVKGKARSYCRPCHNAFYQKRDPRTHKKCRRCQQQKPVVEFRRSGQRFQSSCAQCQNEVVAKYRELNALRISGRYKEYYKAKRKWVKLKSQYKITEEEYRKLNDSQNGVCAICFRAETDVYKGTVLMLAVDHDHTTEVNRGLLCRSCNLALGKFRDDPQILRNALAYLARHGKE